MTPKRLLILLPLLAATGILLLLALRYQSEPTPTSTSTPPPTTITALPSPTSLAPPTPSSIPPPPTPSPQPTQTTTPPPTPTPLLPTGRQIIGYSWQDRPIEAFRVGRGPLKMVIIGGGPATTALYDYFAEQPDEVPANIALWLVPNINPDGEPGSLINARGVALRHNADTGLDGCSINDWSAQLEELGATGGAFPFSEPESRALRAFTDDAWLVIFHEPAAEQVWLDSCRLHLPTSRLAETFADSAGYALAATPERPLTGRLADYLAAQGTATISLALQAEEQARNLAGLRAVLANADRIVAAEVGENGQFTWLDTANTGRWHFPSQSFVHPLALTVIDEKGYLLDGGRVLVFDLETPGPGQVLLDAGDDVAGVRVLELIDLGDNGRQLFALDRAGDVYSYDPAAGIWAMDRYDRPVGETSAHYYTAVAAGELGRYLLETDYDLTMRYQGDERPFAWLLPEHHQIDLSAYAGDTFILSREMELPLGLLAKYNNGGRVTAFAPALLLTQPRQVQATAGSVYVLDRGGRRLSRLDGIDGRVTAVYQFRDGRPMSTFWIDGSEEQLLLAGQDGLYFYGRPEQQSTIPGPDGDAALLTDPAVLDSLRGLLMPIGGSGITRRDNQMPGAPRHYRLGVHEGADFYWQSGTPVLAAADGVVLRATWDYVQPTQAAFDAWRAESLSLGYTSPEAHDFYRGRQIWIDHGGGLVGRYIHLSAIDPSVVEGTPVRRGQVIGYVGNSGSPVSLQGENADAHLHFELWLNNLYLGQFLRPIETREWLEAIFR